MSQNCRICGLDTAAGPSWADANGYRYCGGCLVDLRRQPPYQSPLFKCDTCARAWPLKTLAERDERLLCKDCVDKPAAPIPKAKGLKSSKKRSADGRDEPDASDAGKYDLGPPPSNVLPRMTCPHCWHVFPTDEVLFVSQHAELLGDPVLGPEAQVRFRPSRFNARGEALDGRDMPCQVLACPRCHLTIPRSMTETAPLFVSVIGAPASGKSHFLASMTWELRRVLSEQFGITFNDADTLTNHTLNEYEETLFLQDDAERLVSIRKTEMQGELYDQIRLGEQVIHLPKPFLFTLRPRPRDGKVKRVRMMCLYDNAGEHFQPGMDTASMPGTQHLAKSRVLWFLYDPTQNLKFREQCRQLSQDPQLYHASRTLRQEKLLNEAAARVRRYTGLSAQKKYDRPLVVIVAKADIWGQLLGADLVREPLVMDPAGGDVAAVDIERVEKISAALRQLLVLLSPEFVDAAEDFCKHVVYLPASALGRGPEVEEASGMLGIRPKDIRPQWVTVPFLYMFAKWSAGVIQGVRTSGEGSEETNKLLSKPTTAAAPTAPKEPEEPPAADNGRPAQFELVYTSAPRGLRRGSSGFCTVAATTGISTALADRLESLSSYQPIFPAGSPQAAKNPVLHAHWRVPVGGRPRSVLSRVAFTGLDHTQRPNKLAHHLIVAPGQQPVGGPIWAIRQPGVMLERWEGGPRVLPPTKTLPTGDRPPRPCGTWNTLAGDAGWAGALSEAFLRDPAKVSYIICSAGTDPLPLLEEALALLPPRLRWQVTFSTYFTELPAGLTCAWRCVFAGTAAANDAARYATSGVVLDLTHPLGAAPNRTAARAAREGKMLSVNVPAAATAAPVAT